MRIYIIYINVYIYYIYIYIYIHICMYKSVILKKIDSNNTIKYLTPFFNIKLKFFLNIHHLIIIKNTKQGFKNADCERY